LPEAKQHFCENFHTTLWQQLIATLQ